ncbi:MAG: hypothetical protein HY225_01845 [Candidatus Vogelbacteria bacterium]|nr:hypothetical protein [Candidatus Vogelbacteria bacterium]
MDNMLQNIFGLSAPEAKLFISASQIGGGTISEIAKGAKIARTAAYIPLKNLLKRGLLSIFKVGKRLNYRAIEPTNLVGIYDKNKSDLEHIISELSKTIRISSGLDIRYFPSETGISIASEIFLSESRTKLWRSFENPLYTNQTFYLREIEKYDARRVSKKIRGKVIVSTDTMPLWLEDFMKHNTEELRETLIIPYHRFPFDASVASNGDMVLIIFGKQMPSSILIKNRDLAVTLDSIFDFVWSKSGIE